MLLNYPQKQFDCCRIWLRGRYLVAYPEGGEQQEEHERDPEPPRAKPIISAPGFLALLVQLFAVFVALLRKTIRRVNHVLVLTPIEGGGVGLLVVGVGMLHTSHVGRLACLGIVRPAALPELNDERVAVGLLHVLGDKVHGVADVPAGRVFPVDGGRIADVYLFVNGADGFAADQMKAQPKDKQYAYPLDHAINNSVFVESHKA